ncbi:MAG: Type 1 glutamine amidotransferase-like domain-containing protein [Microthrixaceae bacterium]
MNGILALVGGEEFTAGCSFDEGLLADVTEVLLIPAALAYENPGEVIARAEAYFAAFGVGVQVLDCYRRAEALELLPAELAASAQLIYLTGGSPMHLRSVLKDTPLFESIIGAWQAGATIVAAGEAASVLCSSMVDSRGGAFTIGLDLIQTMTVIPRYNQWSQEKWHRTVELAKSGLEVVGIDEATALIRSADGRWSVEGAGTIHVFTNGSRSDISALSTDLNQ